MDAEDPILHELKSINSKLGWQLTISTATLVFLFGVILLFFLR